MCVCVRLASAMSPQRAARAAALRRLCVGVVYARDRDVRRRALACGCARHRWVSDRRAPAPRPWSMPYAHGRNREGEISRWGVGVYTWRRACLGLRAWPGGTSIAQSCCQLPGPWQMPGSGWQFSLVSDPFPLISDPLIRWQSADQRAWARADVAAHQRQRQRQRQRTPLHRSLDRSTAGRRQITFRAGYARARARAARSTQHAVCNVQCAFRRMHWRRPSTRRGTTGNDDEEGTVHAHGAAPCHACWPCPMRRWDHGS